MTVRIHIARWRVAGLARARDLPLGPAIGSLLAPLALIAYLLCAARLGTDLGLLQLSAPEGVWSHWQVWMALAVTSHLLARRLLEAHDASHRRANLQLEVRGREDWHRQEVVENAVKNKVKEMVKEALDPYESELDGAEAREEVLSPDGENRREITRAEAPRPNRRPVFRFATRSPISAEAEALRQRVRRF